MVAVTGLLLVGAVAWSWRTAPAAILVVTGAVAVLACLLAAELGWLGWRFGGSGAMAYAGAGVLAVGLVTVPVATASPVFITPRSGFEAARVGIGVLGIAMLRRAVRAPSVDTSPGLRWVGIGAVPVLGVAALGRQPVTHLEVIDLVVGLCSLVAGLGLVGAGVRADRLLSTRCGVGATFLALGLLARGAAETLPPVGVGFRDAAPMALAASGMLRAVGTLWVVAGMVAEARALPLGRRRDDDRLRRRAASAEEQTRRLREAQVELSHEIRSALLGVEGAAIALGRVEGALADADRATLATSVAAELHRLKRLVDPAGRGDGPRSFAPSAVLANVVRTDRAAGLDVTLEPPEGGAQVRALGCPDALAEAVSNVLANAARHAPGAPVRVRVQLVGDRVQIRIDDDGPGFPPGASGQVGTRGWRAAAAGGSGLGLYLSAQALGTHGGTLVVQTGGPGARVVLDLPAAGTAP